MQKFVIKDHNFYQDKTHKCFAFDVGKILYELTFEFKTEKEIGYKKMFYIK